MCERLEFGTRLLICLSSAGGVLASDSDNTILILEPAIAVPAATAKTKPNHLNSKL
jgi:hypothetical protein